MSAMSKWSPAHYFPSLQFTGKHLSSFGAMGASTTNRATKWAAWNIGIIVAALVIIAGLMFLIDHHLRGLHSVLSR